MRLFTRSFSSRLCTLTSLIIRRLKAGKEQLPIITTSTETDELGECTDEKRKDRRKCDKQDEAHNTPNENGTTSLNADVPNFSTALQLRENVEISTTSVAANRPIYPNIPYSPYSSPRTVRRKSPLKESRRVSIDKCGSYQQLNQYKLIDSIGQVSLLKS